MLCQPMPRPEPLRVFISYARKDAADLPSSPSPRQVAVIRRGKRPPWRRLPSGWDGKPWKGGRPPPNRMRSCPGTECSSPTGSTAQSVVKPEVVPSVEQESERLVVRMARENPNWGYDRIVGAMANL